MCFIIVIWGRKTMRNQQLQTDYTEDMVGYWKERSHTYSKDNRSQLENEKKTVWENLILSNTTQEKQLNILDVGTGPGFFAVLLAQKGHHVTAVDVSADMLERAKENLVYYQVHADLRLLDGNDLPFSDDTFDLVISRDVTWTLQQPEETLLEWKRVAKPGGQILYFDANWYYHLFDEEWMKLHLENEKIKSQNGLPIHDKGKVMEEIARELPMSKRLRPTWDLDELPQLGFRNVKALKNLNSVIYTEEEQLKYRSKPEFLVIAEK